MQFPGEDLYSSCVVRQISLCLMTWHTWHFVCLERDEEKARKITDQRCRTGKQGGIIKIWMVHYDNIIIWCKNVKCIRYISMFCVCVHHLHTPCYTLCLYWAFICVSVSVRTCMDTALNAYTRLHHASWVVRLYSGETKRKASLSGRRCPATAARKIVYAKCNMCFLTALWC